MMGGMFDEFKGLVSREEKQQKTALDFVLDGEAKVIEKYVDAKPPLFDYEQYELYELILEETREKLQGTVPSPELIQTYVSSRENQNEDREAIIRGMYSASLLEIMCTTESDAYISIDGKGKVWNYLFLHVKHAKNITVKNIKGDFILACAGSRNGNVAYVLLDTIEGEETLSNAGDKGRIEHVLLNNVKGNKTLSWAGTQGYVQYLIMNNVAGKDILRYVGERGGMVKDVTIKNSSESYYVFKELFSDGSVDYFIFSNSKTEFSFCKSKKKSKLNVSPFQDGPKAPIKESQKETLAKIVWLTESMSALSFEEQKKMHDEIARLQIKLFEEERE